MSDEEFTPSDISEWFWDVIERADRSEDKLQAILDDFSKADVHRFEDEFQEAAGELDDDRFREHLASDISDDSIEDIANWVVSQGKKYYSDVWENPELIPRHVEMDDPHNLAGVAASVFWRRFKQGIGGYEP